MPLREAGAWFTGVIGLALVWIVLLIATKKHPWALVIGEDGRPSTSKFQIFVWTAAVVFAFLAIFELRFASGYYNGLPGVPTNLLIAMGISVATAVSAKSIAMNAQTTPDSAAGPAVTVAAVATPNDPATPAVAAVITPPPPTATQTGGIFTDDEGRPDLGKVQLVLWTVIAVSVFLSQVFAVVNAARSVDAISKLSLPDIGRTLMILMGLGHGAYIGKKLAES
jgi:hypothetical protein